jgi:serine/threonine protein phosphatase 1
LVFKRLFKSVTPAPPPAPAVPAGQRIYAIGDVHGCLSLLDQLLLEIEADHAARSKAEKHLIFLGDLMDRGPESRGVIERVMELCAASPNNRCIIGNHEELLIRAFEGDAKIVPTFHRAGGRETMISYGMSDDLYDELDSQQLAPLIANYVPQAHIDFLSGLEDWFQAGDYLFVHAGIRPGRALADQRQSDMRWIREEFTRHEGNHGFMVIHGHSITEFVDDQPNRIGIDTGAFATGKLTAIALEGEERWFLDTSG